MKNTDKAVTDSRTVASGRTKAEKRAERMSWAIWAAGVYSAEKSKQAELIPQSMIGVIVDAKGNIVKKA